MKTSLRRRKERRRRKKDEEDEVQIEEGDKDRLQYTLSLKNRL